MIRLADSRVSEQGVEAVAAVLRSGQLIASAECAAFEAELASFIGVEHAIAVSSGTAALHLSAIALGIGPGDAVLVPDFTFPATANAMHFTGARPVPVDVDPTTYTLAIPELERALNTWNGPERLAAIVPVHEFGRCADMAGVLEIARREGFLVIEDAACALGASGEAGFAGAMGDVGCFSFHPRKSLTTGDGGAITTNDDKLAGRLRRLRNHGMERRGATLEFVETGLNYRLTEFQAALGRVGLHSFHEELQARQRIALSYPKGIAHTVGNGLARLPVDIRGHSWQTYMIVLEDRVDRQRLIADLGAAGVEASVGAQSLSALGLYGEAIFATAVGQELAKLGLAIPCHARMTPAETQHVCEALTASLEAQL